MWDEGGVWLIAAVIRVGGSGGRWVCGQGCIVSNYSQDAVGISVGVTRGLPDGAEPVAVSCLIRLGFDDKIVSLPH